jgi:hypothetical protein
MYKTQILTTAEAIGILKRYPLEKTAITSFGRHKPLV